VLASLDELQGLLRAPMARTRGTANREKLEFRDRLRRYMRGRNVDPHYFMVALIADDSTKTVVNADGSTTEVPTIYRSALPSGGARRVPW